MKIIKTLLCSSLLSVSSLGVFNVNAEDGGWAMSTLIKQARSLGIAETAEPAASESPAWHSLTVETPGAGEQNFWDDLYTGVSKTDICENISLPIEYGYESEKLGTVTGSANRRFHRYSDNTLALVDEAGLKFEFSAEKPLMELADVGGVSVVGGIRLEGSSIVIRPLGGSKACGELKQYVNVLKYKTVLPFKAERFAAMKTGEVWKLPITLWTGITPTVSGGYGNVTVSVELGVEGQRLPSVSLARLSDHELRVRLRIDQARIMTVGGSVGVTIAPVVVGLDNLTAALTSQMGKVASQVVAKTIASRFEQYTNASLGLSHSSTKGKKVLLEFTLDPQNKEQMEVLVKLLRDGELKSVSALAKLAAMTFLPGHNNITDETELVTMQNNWNARLGIKPGYSGQNGYHESATEFTLHLPVVTDYTHNSGHNYQTAHTPGSNETVHVNESFRETNHDVIHVPFSGTVMRHNSERTVSVYNNEADGKVGAPVMRYEQLEGMIRYSPESARGMLVGVNEIMRYAGTRGEGNNSAASIPVSQIQPEGGDGHYKAAFLSFAVLFNEKAVQDIIAAPAELLIKAYANSLDAVNSAIMKKVLSVSTIGADGKIMYKQSAVEKVLGASINAMQEGQNIMDQVNTFCRTATRIVVDLAKIRNASDWKSQSEILSKVMAGDSKSDLKYGDILKVVIQVVEPRDVAAELIYRAERKAASADDVSVQYSYNHEDNPGFAAIDGAIDTMDHFDDAPQLAD